jgi:hypothetical protein
LKEKAMTNPAKWTSIEIPANLRSGNLRDASLLYNAIGANGLQAIFPPDMGADFVYKHLSQHLAAAKDLGSSREAVSAAVEVRADAVKRGHEAHARLKRIVDGTYPPGRPGRSDFFPKAETAPVDGDLLLAIAAGALKHKLPLPAEYTPATIAALGKEVNAALEQRDSSGKLRQGRSKATIALEKTTLQIRARLREIVTGWYGRFDAKLLDFGIQPQKPRTGRPRKHVEQPAGAMLA